jgi:hypothetical protein
MPKGKKKKEVRDPSKPAIHRWSAKKWASEHGEKWTRALEAAGPDFTFRLMQAHSMLVMERQLEKRIKRLEESLEDLKVKATADPDFGRGIVEMDACEKILAGIVQALPNVTVKEKPKAEEPRGEPVEVSAAQG